MFLRMSNTGPQATGLAFGPNTGTLTETEEPRASIGSSQKQETQTKLSFTLDAVGTEAWDGTAGSARLREAPSLGKLGVGGGGGKLERAQQQRATKSTLLETPTHSLPPS